VLPNTRLEEYTALEIVTDEFGLLFAAASLTNRKRV